MTTTKPNRSVVVSPSVVSVYAIAVVAIGIAYSTHGNLTNKNDAMKKPLAGSLHPTFYDFYLQEHRDPICRILHFLGTTMATTTLIRCGVLPHLLIGLSFGLVLCELLSSFTSNGLIEFVTMIITMVVSFHLQQKQSSSSSPSSSSSFPWQILFMGYLPAWIGHYFFEHNTPATFIYPSYSLLSDHIMWFQIVTGQLPWNERL